MFINLNEIGHDLFGAVSVDGSGAPAGPSMQGRLDGWRNAVGTDENVGRLDVGRNLGRLVERNRIAGVDVTVQDQDRHGLEFLNELRSLREAK